MRFRLITIFILTIILATLVFTPAKALSPQYIPGMASGSGPYGMLMCECPWFPFDCICKIIG